MDKSINSELKIDNPTSVEPVENSETQSKTEPHSAKVNIKEPDAMSATKKPKRKPRHINWNKIMLGTGIGGIVLGGGLIIYSVLNQPQIKNELTFPVIGAKATDSEVYSDLTGEVLSSSDLKTAPAYCIQTPNGTDGARPQVGLNQAGVIFEAVAEAGITRFAAIYQNPTSAVIGPVRSLRIYYLEWDTPFDCTIVHAGGAENALSAVTSGGYQDLSEDYSYMYRGTAGNRLWNNLFTTSEKLNQFSTSHGYDKSEIKGFKRMTPAESDHARVKALAKNALVITKATDESTSELENTIDTIGFDYGNVPSFNVRYNYNSEQNVYERSYGNGLRHDIYTCPEENLGEKDPENVCTLTQMTPSVVIAMIVQESRDSDGYHEKINTVGSGDAYIFQNGTVIKGTWNKASVSDQIKFIDENDNEIALAPGQTFISAVPTYGSIDY